MGNSTDRAHVIRLRPGDDLRGCIEKTVDEGKIDAGWIVSCVGSLRSYCLRFASRQEPSTSNGFFEIVSLSGTVSRNGCHLHMAIADSTGTTVGGHLLHGCTIYTTAEIVLTSSGNYVFKRAHDPDSGCNELWIGQQ
jgi:predicted DNA-binding protein with PD1-like motif